MYADTRMRLLHVVPTYLPALRYGGPIHSVHGLARALASRGHEVHVFTTNVDGADDSDVPLGRAVDVDGVNVWYFPSRRMRRLYWSPPMARALEESLDGFDLAHLHSIFLWPTAAAASLARKLEKPYVLAPRGMLVRELIARKSTLLKQAWITAVERRNLECASAIHVTSELERDECMAFGFSLPPIVVVPNGVDTASGGDEPLSTPVAAALRHDRLVLFLGRLNWKKGLDRLIPAMTRVQDAHLVIAGNDEDGYAEVVRELVRSNGMGERVSLVGAVAGADKAALLENASLLVLPSYSENFGNVVLEAAAHGRPVIVTPEVGLAPVVADGGAGVVCAGEPRALADAMVDLLRDAEKAATLGENGRRMVAERFSWDLVAESMERAYRTVLDTS
jgi:glycosyltransferase involved in cell wall biosynthesis